MSLRPVRLFRFQWVMLFCAATLFSSAQGRAATITAHDDPVMGCNILVSGVIVEGDADTLRALIEEQDARSNWFSDATSPSGQRICLRSPGGSLTEGLKMASVIKSAGHGMGRGTAVPEGATCLSACALTFMAGSWFHPEGETWSPNRVMHPTATLGFHAPILRVREMQYTAENVTEAYSLALDSLAEIIKRRAEERYVFAESLFVNMLAYSGEENFYYIDTVGKAARNRIAVAPTGANLQDVDDAILNLCASAEAALLDRPAEDLLEYLEVMPAAIEQRAGALFASLPFGFREEASEGCSIRFHEPEEWQFRERDLGAFLGTASIGEDQMDRVTYVSASQTFPPSTPLSELPPESDIPFRAIVQTARPSTVALRSCWLQTADARISNVENFVNMRSTASLSSRVVRQIPAGEIVTLRDPARPTAANANDRDRQACVNTCNSLRDNPDDAQAAERAAECIGNNVIWYQVRDSTGNTGWISRNYLSPATAR